MTPSFLKTRRKNITYFPKNQPFGINAAVKSYFSWFSQMFTTLLCVYTLVAYGLGYTLWLNHWTVGFVLLSLPLAMMGCLMVGVWLLFRKPKRAIFPLVVFVLGYPFLQRTFAWHSDSVLKKGSFRILSYNAMFFDVDAVSEHRHSEANAVAMMKWINAFDADIKCFQEFYNWEGQKRFKEFNTTDQLTRQGFTYQLFAQPNSVKKKGWLCGLGDFFEISTHF